MNILDASIERNTRRTRIYSGRVWNSLLGTGLKHQTIYLHLPKCGGTSISEALYATVPMHKRIGVIDALSTRRAASLLEFGLDDPWKCHDDLEFGDRTFALRERLLATHCCWESHLVSGHLLMSHVLRSDLLQRYKLLTIMRDPIARTISNYRMAIAAGIADPNPEAWLATPIARAHATTYLRYLSGCQYVAPSDETACLERAFSALEMFSLIGFLEDLVSFKRDFKRIFGARLKLRSYNQAKGDEVKLSKPHMTRLREICAADLAIYQRARDLSAKENLIAIA